MKNSKTFRKGLFNPRNPQKYQGDIKNIVYRSSWEKMFFEFCDNNVNVLKWGSEILKIPYIKPTDGEIHHYYPDVFIQYRDKDGNIQNEVIEIKPEKQVDITKNKKLSLYEQVTYAINVSKWKYATAFCKKHNIRFRVLTEKQLFAIYK
jgi:hypothetical protein